MIDSTSASLLHNASYDLPHEIVTYLKTVAGLFL